MSEGVSNYLKKIELGKMEGDYFKSAYQIGLSYKPAHQDQYDKIKPSRITPLYQARKPLTHAGGYLTTYGVSFKDRGPAIESHTFTYRAPPIYTELKPFGKRSDLYRNRKTEYGEEYAMRAPTIPPPPLQLEKLAFCPMMATGRDEREAVDLKSNYSKHLDIYVSTSRMDYRPYNEVEQKSIQAAKDIVTLNDTMGMPKGKGFGPRFPVFIDKDIERREVPMLDKDKFKTEPKLKILPKIVPRVPNSGMESETQGEYTIPGGYARPHIFNAFAYQPDSIVAPTAKQGTSPPGMYFSEQTVIHNSTSPQTVV